MGHRGRLDDWPGVQAVATTIIMTAREFVFPGEVEWLRELGDRTVRAQSFDAYFRLQHDPLDWRAQNPVDWRPEKSRTMIVVRFARAGQSLPDEPWSVRVRGDWPIRRDRLPDDSPFSSKSLRTGRGWKNRTIRRRRAAGSEQPIDSSIQRISGTHSKVPWGRHDSLWIAEVTERQDADQMIDLQAQVGLFLLQTDTVRNDGEVRDGLVEYLRSTFRWRGVEEPDADAYVVYHHLLTHKWWSDDWRAWRKLIRGCIDGLRKKERPQVVDPLPDEDGRLTVDQFARASGRSRSSRAGDRRCMIAATAVPPVTGTPRRSDIVALLMKRGRSRAAARKWVYRQELRGRSLADIAASVVGGQTAVRMVGSLRRSRRSS
jgi:hypothetical protein